MVYSKSLTNWTPYLLAFAQAAPTAGTPATHAASPDTATVQTSSEQTYRKEVLAGIRAGAGIILALAILLSVRALQLYNHAGSYDGLLDANARKTPGQLALGQSRPFNAQSHATTIRSPGTIPAANARSAPSTLASTQVSRSSILGKGLRKDDVERILTGKTRRETMTLLGSPDAATRGGMLWRYTDGVQIYEPGLDLTFFSVEITFRHSPQSTQTPRIVQSYPRSSSNRSSSPVQQLDDTIGRLDLVSVPRPQHGQVK
jgi:hypothetical protein